MKSIIARNIKRIIEESGYKQAAIAKKAGYTPGMFSNMLNGRVLPILWWIAPKSNLFLLLPKCHQKVRRSPLSMTAESMP